MELSLSSSLRKTTLLILLGTLIYPSLVRAEKRPAEMAKVMRLTSSSSKGPSSSNYLKQVNTWCSATLVKDENNNCHLVTNYHCVRESNVTFQVSRMTDNMDLGFKIDYFKKHHPYTAQEIDVGLTPSETQADSSRPKGFIEGSLSPQKVSVVRKDPGMDLAELSIPHTPAFINACKSMSNSFETISRSGKTRMYSELNLLIMDMFKLTDVASVGFPKYGREIYRAGQWDRNVQGPIGGWGLQSQRLVLPGLSDRLAALFEFGGLRVEKGMSGGGAFDLDTLEFVGIIVRLIDTQYASYIIPAREVRKFLDEPVLIYRESQEQTKLYNHLSGCVNAGDNEHGAGGDNEHGAGGDNEHGAGGDACRASAFGWDHQNLAQMPLEGYLLPDGHTRILAVNDTPINGYDDFTIATKLWKKGHPMSQPNFIEREESGYLSIPTRKGTLDRLVGQFTSAVNENLKGSSYEGFESFLELIESQWAQLFYLKPNYTLGISKIQDGHYQIVFNTKLKNPLGVPDKTNPEKWNIQYPRIELNFTGIFRLEDDAKTLILDLDDGQSLRCDNRSYQQIICTGPKMLIRVGVMFDPFSPMLKSLEFKILNKRFVNKEGITHQAIDYYYGRVGNLADFIPLLEFPFEAGRK